jgi:SNF2 family DNA or RNA helicase
MLYPHQEEGCRRMMEGYSRGFKGFFDNSIMGAGKSRTFLTFYARVCAQRQGERRPCSLLLVAPLAVLFHWKQEVEHVLDVTVYIYQGPTRHNIKLEGEDGSYCEPFIVLTTVEALRADWKKIHQQKGQKGQDQRLFQYPFHILGVDEAHNFANMEENKNPGEAPLYKSIFNRLKRDYTVILTGTPLKNDESDIRSLMSLAQLPLPAVASIEELGKHYARYSYRAPVEEIVKNLPPVKHEVVFLDYVSSAIADEAKALMGVYQQIKAKVQSYLSRGQRVPPPLQTQLNAARTHCRFFDAVHAKSIKDMPSQKPSQTSQKSTKTFSLLAHYSKNAKFLYVFTFIKNHAELKIVISSEFASVLRELSLYLSKQGIKVVLFDGSCDRNKRQKSLDAYLNHDVNVLLLSKKAGGSLFFFFSLLFCRSPLVLTFLQVAASISLGMLWCFSSLT